MREVSDPDAAGHLRVGLDYLPASTHGPGVGRYARELVRALVRLEPGALDLRLFDVGRGGRRLPAAALGLEGSDARRLRAPLPRRALKPLAHLGLGADRLLGGVDVFHHVLVDPPPVTRARQTLAVSELPEPGSRAGARLGRTLARMDLVFCFSSDAAERLAREYGVPEQRLRRLAVGCEHFRRDAPAGARPADPPEILALGALEPRREPRALLAAFERLRERGVDARLRLLGRRGSLAAPLAAAIERSPARAAIEWRVDPGEPELPEALSRASLLVHLSRAEGTAVTPLEAFAFGLPAVVSPLPAFREALGTEAHYAPADDVELLAATLARALAGAGDETRRAARLALAARNSWERNARATLAAWRALAAR